MKTNIDFKSLAMADLDINSNAEPISKETEQALSEFIKNRKKSKSFIRQTASPTLMLHKTV
jgi:hypothetical protein